LIYFRHIQHRLGADVAAFAAPRKVAALIYRLLPWGHAYVDEGAEAYEQPYQTARINRLVGTVADLGYQLVAKPTNP
jgi:hypothetical protein